MQTSICASENKDNAMKIVKERGADSEVGDPIPAEIFARCNRKTKRRLSLRNGTIYCEFECACRGVKHESATSSRRADENIVLTGVSHSRAEIGACI